jgi:hypothetical protein
MQICHPVKDRIKIGYKNVSRYCTVGFLEFSHVHSSLISIYVSLIDDFMYTRTQNTKSLRQKPAMYNVHTRIIISSVTFIV